METVRGPIAPLKTGSIIYQITLASGMIITSPSAFGFDENAVKPAPIIVGEDGRVFVGPQRRGEEGICSEHQIDGQEVKEGPEDRS
ncbi:MAG: hypothetical protein ABSG19_13700 [Candidatus Aminicenantales bacterium]